MKGPKTSTTLFERSLFPKTSLFYLYEGAEISRTLLGPRDLQKPLGRSLFYQNEAPRDLQKSLGGGCTTIALLQQRSWRPHLAPDEATPPHFLALTRRDRAVASVLALTYQPLSSANLVKTTSKLASLQNLIRGTTPQRLSE